jgi:aminoglycoside phosphotransferase (APT) family kinase protein
MVYLEPSRHPVWKEELLAGRMDVGFAAAVGRDLARIHAATAGRAEVEAQFHTDDLFMALRIDPFLLYVAERNAEAAPRLRFLAADLQTRKTALAHGDISPKNILMGPDGPVFIDAECAVYGDPAFDLAFCLTHLLIKAVHVKGRADQMVGSFGALWDAYGWGIDWEPREAVSARAAALVAALLLARVDGKSPAPYLRDEADKALIRRQGMALLADTSLTLDELSRRWRAA